MLRSLFSPSRRSLAGKGESWRDDEGRKEKVGGDHREEAGDFSGNETLNMSFNNFYLAKEAISYHRSVSAALMVKAAAKSQHAAKIASP